MLDTESSPSLFTHYDKYHGYNGPIKVHPVGETTKISKAFIDAGEEIGYKEIGVSGREHEGCYNCSD